MEKFKREDFTIPTPGALPVPTPPPKREIAGESRKRTAFVIECLTGLERMLRTELDEAAYEFYVAALLPEDPAQLHVAILDGLREWKFFPSIAEILARIPRDNSAAAQRAEAAREQLAQRYREAKRAGLLPVSPFRSVLEDRKLLTGAVRRKVADMTPEQQEARIALLRAQAAKLAQDGAA